MSLEFSAHGEQTFQEIVGRYPNTLAALLPALLLAQSEFGWVSIEVMDYVAQRLDLNPAQVLSTATFYTMVNKQPVGKCHVQVCTTLSCALRGGYELMARLERDLPGIHNAPPMSTGETSSDENFTLTEVECLASCGTAPMLQVSYADGEIEYFEGLGDEASYQAMIHRLNERLQQLNTPAAMHDRALGVE